MVRIRPTSEIIRGFLDFYRVAQPLMSVAPGATVRDVVVDGPSIQLGLLYQELAKVSNSQSIRNSTGTDFQNWAANFRLTKKLGSKATGPVLLLFNNIDADIAIRKGDIVTAKNGSTFIIKNNLVISTVLASSYKSIAAKYRADLDFLGRTEQYAVEVVVEASATGEQGNQSKYGIISTQISGITYATNVIPIGGGYGIESDALFKNRVFASLNSANTGTAIAYENIARTDGATLDVQVISAGDSLMTRDGTQVFVAEDGSRTILSEGTGGKIDIIALGAKLQENIDSFVYRDKSNTNDPTNVANDFVLGQILGDENKTVTRKRLDNLQTGILPLQPINNIVSVSGSLSGLFKPKSVNSLGVVSGNYELIKDTGAYAGSCWGFDRLRWISNKITDFSENKTKGVFNGQDSLTFTDVLELKSITQNIVVTNENSKVSPSNRSSIQLSHYPVTAVNRVFNVTTGERYIITNQNPDGSGVINNTGRITITGKSLPAVSDVLQVDYTWICSFDPYWDFDNKVFSNNAREVADSIDWGYSNLVRRERAVLTGSGNYLILNVSHNVSAVISVNVFVEETSSITIVSGRKAVIVSQVVNNVISIARSSDEAELWNTIDDDGSISALTIYLPTDTIGEVGDSVTVVYNATDVYNDDIVGSFSGAQITIVPTDVATAGTIVEVNYLANVNTLLPNTLISNLPAIRNVNSFDTNNTTSIGVQPVTNLYSGNTIVRNLRQAPSFLGLTINGNIVPGVITVSGTTLTSGWDIVFTASANGLKQDLSSALRKVLGLNSKTSISNNVKLARVVKVEKVRTNNSLEVLEVLHQYDVQGYTLLDNSLVKTEALNDSSFSKTEFELPSTENNLDNDISIGDRIRIRFYFTTTSDTENVYFSKSGTLYTNKRFVYVDTIAVSSGFNSSGSLASTISITNLNQPIIKSIYKCYYDYEAPKTNERISVTYNTNKLIGDIQLLIEDKRALNDDILVKESNNILVDIIMYIVVDNNFTNSSSVVRQNVQDAITSALNVGRLNPIIDQSDLQNIAYTVNGVDRVRITYFNKTGNTGSVLSISAQKNQTILANNVQVIVESR